VDKTIAVLGTGANGSCAAADLTNAGHHVTLIDQWPAHVEAMRAHGLKIAMPDRELHVSVNAHHLCDVCTLNRSFDIVFLAMKAYDTRWACEFIKPYLKSDSIVVGLQNAMTADAIAEVVGPTRTVGCVVELSSELFTPGAVRRNTPPEKSWFGLGSLDGAAADRLPEIAALLRHVGRVSITEDVRSAKWMKLVVNTMCLAPFAIMGSSMGDAAKLPGMRDLFLRVGAEALDLGEAFGYRIEPIFGLTPEDMRATNRPLEKMFDKLATDLAGRNERNCVLQDMLKGRYSEVDLINGLVVEECERLGRAAPANTMIVALAREIQHGRLQPSPENLDVALKMLRD
jgi:2-dehydropantoate 2-reductase